MELIATGAIMYVCLLLSLSVHEAAHAATANACGDPTGRLMGRATLNPIPHIDPIGTVLMPLMMIVFPVPFLFGWAKPVPFNPRNLNNVRRDPSLIALAGPFSNILLVAVFLLLSRLLMVLVNHQVIGPLPSMAVLFLAYMILINMVLAAFNMIPLPPLDGHHLLAYIAPPKVEEILERIGPFGILIAVFFIARPLFRLLAPVFDGVLALSGLPLMV